MDFEHKMVIVVSSDVKLSNGKMAAQVGHASVVCAIESKKRRTRAFQSWYEEGQRKVVLKAPLKEMFEIKAQVERGSDMFCVLIKDAGLTEVPPGTITCLGIGPGPEEEIDRFTGHLKLR